MHNSYDPQESEELFQRIDSLRAHSSAPSQFAPHHPNTVGNAGDGVPYEWNQRISA